MEWWQCLAFYRSRVGFLVISSRPLTILAAGFNLFFQGLNRVNVSKPYILKLLKLKAQGYLIVKSINAYVGPGMYVCVCVCGHVYGCV